MNITSPNLGCSIYVSRLGSLREYDYRTTTFMATCPLCDCETKLLLGFWRVKVNLCCAAKCNSRIHESSAELALFGQHCQRIASRREPSPNGCHRSSTMARFQPSGGRWSSGQVAPSTCVTS